MASDQPHIAIYCSTVGTASETFIKRYVHKLLPGRTVVLTEFSPVPGKPPTWSTQCPTFHITQNSGGLRRRAWSVGRSRFSLPLMRLGFGDVLRFLEDHDVSVVLGNWLDVSWPFIHLCKRNGIRFFGHAHGCDLSISYRVDAWKRRFKDYSCAQGVIVVNKVMEERMLGLGVPQDKLHLIPYGVEDAASTVTHRVADGERVRCLAVGRMVNKKAPITLLEAFRIAQAESGKLALDYVGDGPLLDDATRYVESNDLTEHVKLHGQLSHDSVLELMDRSDILLQHSLVDPETGDEEGLPLVILEAMAHGLAVIATRHGGIPEAVSHPESGLLVDEGDADEMARCLVRVASQPEKAAAMGKRGREIYLQRYTWDLERQNLLRILGFGSNDT